MILTLPYCQKDSTLLVRLLHWMAELNSDYKPHSCLLVADNAVPQNEKVSLQELAKPLFLHTETIRVNVPATSQKWPDAPNIMFAAAARQIAECYRKPWLWMEPDCVPLTRFWMDEISDAYDHCPKRFMGCFVTNTTQPDIPPVHLSGCAVYDGHAWQGLEAAIKGKTAWDINAAAYTVPRAMDSPLFQYFWGKPELSPTFRETKGPTDPENTIPLGWLRKDAVLFHRCKDSTLIDLLRSKRTNKVSPAAHTAPAQMPKPALKS